MTKRKSSKRKRKKKWIGKAVKRLGALRAKAAKSGGLTKSGKVSKVWARSQRAKLRAKPNRTKAETRTLRQLNLFLNQLTR